MYKGSFQWPAPILTLFALKLLTYVVLASQEPVKSLLTDLESLTGSVGNVDKVVTDLLSTTQLSSLLSPLTGLLSAVFAVVTEILSVVKTLATL